MVRREFVIPPTADGRHVLFVYASGVHLAVGLAHFARRASVEQALLTHSLRPCQAAALLRAGAEVGASVRALAAAERFDLPSLSLDQARGRLAAVLAEARRGGFDQMWYVADAAPALSAASGARVHLLHDDAAANASVVVLCAASYRELALDDLAGLYRRHRYVLAGGAWVESPL
jgi:hypothetical protein